MRFYPDAINNETIKILNVLVQAGYLVNVEDDDVLCIDINGPAARIEIPPVKFPIVTYTSNANTTNFKTTLDDQ